MSATDPSTSSTKCKFCNIHAKKYVVSIKCESAYHHSSALKFLSLRVTQEGIPCCETPPTSKRTKLNTSPISTIKEQLIRGISTDMP